MEPNSGRVTFYNGDEIVGSFISLHGFVVVDNSGA